MALIDIVNREEIAFNKRYDNLPDIVKIRLENVKAVAKAIDNLSIDDSGELETLFNDIHLLLDNGLLSPLSLQDDEFYNGINIRCGTIVKDENGIIDLSAYKLLIKHAYNGDNNKEISEFVNSFITTNQDIYFTAGGAKSNDYFTNCYIKENNINNKQYYQRQSVIIPVSIVTYPESGKSPVFLMDKREPAFYELKKDFNIPIYKDEKINKIDVRKFVKLH